MSLSVAEIGGFVDESPRLELARVRTLDVRGRLSRNVIGRQREGKEGRVRGGGGGGGGGGRRGGGRGGGGVLMSDRLSGSRSWKAVYSLSSSAMTDAERDYYW